MSAVLERFGLVDEVKTDADTSETAIEKGDGESATVEDGESTEFKQDGSGQDADGEGTEEKSTVDEVIDSSDVSKEKRRAKTVKSIEQQLEEEKGFRTRIQRELKEAKEQIGIFSELKSKFDELRGELNASKKPVEPELTFEDHPLEYLKTQIDKLSQGLSGVVQHTTNTSQINKHERNIQDLLNKGDKSFTAYAKQQSDFSEAMTHLRGVRLQQFDAMGYSESESEQMLINETIDMLKRSYQNDHNPAEVAYQIAKINGFKSRGVAEKVIKKTSHGQDKNKTIGGVGSGSNKESSLVSMEDLAGMSDADFDKNWELVMRKQRGR